MTRRGPTFAGLLVLGIAGGAASATTRAPVRSIHVVNAVLSDDGDGDGWADTRETIEMRVTVRNLTGADLTGLVMLVSTDSPEIAGITDNRILFGDLADGETRLSDDAFGFVVADVDRPDMAADLSVTFRFVTYADQYDLGKLVGDPSELTLDLDLDTSGGAGPTTYFESFETGFGTFTTMHLDETLNPPPGDINNHALGVAAADGWRCQYSDPDWVNANSYNNSQALVCYPSQNGVPDTYYWHVASERAFTGEQSLHYGVFLDPSRLYTTPRAQLEAIRTSAPINLGWADVCSVSRTTFCGGDVDCPPGETCVPSAPQFTFRHQVSFIDNRSIHSGVGRAGDRGIVAAQIAAEGDGSPIGSWVRLEPFVNLYDTAATSNYFNCLFDPADDGNTEDDFFDPTDPLRRLGPSSMCYPNFNFVFQGSTRGTDTSQGSKASDGPGVRGAKGPGLWVEPQFDLSRFRGSRLRLRYVASGLKAGSAPLWHPGFLNNTAANPDPRDDGWFIDDVRVTDALVSPASGGPDHKDNSGLLGLDDPDSDGSPLDNCPNTFNPDQLDTDQDGAGDACDACPLDAYDDRYDDGSCCPDAVGDDPDGDGVCGSADTCPGRFNPDRGASFRIAPGRVGTWFITADSGRVVFTRGSFGPSTLLSVPLDGGAETVLYELAESLSSARLGQTPDGATVLFAPRNLYRIPAVGGAAQQLSGPLIDAGRVEEFVVSRDGLRVVYWADADTDNVGELYSVPLAGGPPAKLNPPLPAGRSVERTRTGWDLALDGTRVVYRADQETDNFIELYSVPTGGGVATKLHAMANVSGFAITPDSAHVVFQGGAELFSVPIAGGPVIKLNGPLVTGGRVVSFAVAPDSSSVLYRADQDVDEVVELYVVPIGGGTPLKLNAPLVSRGDVAADFAVAPDGARVVYRDDQRLDNVSELYSVPIGGGAVERLAPGLSVEVLNLGGRFSFSPDSTRVVFEAVTHVIPNEVDVYSVAIAGGPLAQLNASGPAEWSSSHIAPDGATVAYHDPVRGLFHAPIAGGPETRASERVVPGAGGGLAAFAPDSSTLVYGADQQTYGLKELYATPLSPDADADGIYTVCDNCPAATNAGQADLDGDAIGDACDGCPNVSDPDQADLDGDAVGDACDDCPNVSDPDQADLDGDAVGDACDCAPADATTHPGATEVNDGVDNQCPGDAGFGQVDELEGEAVFDAAGAFVWTAQPGATLYEVARAATPDFTVGCALATTADPWWVDPEVPPAGGAFYYLSRALAPHAGSWGVDSAGNERGPLCP